MLSQWSLQGKKVLVVLAVAVLAGCSSVKPQAGNVAVVNGKPVTVREFEDNYERMLKTMALEPNALKEEKLSPLAKLYKRLALQELLVNELVKQETAKRNITVTEAEVDEAYLNHVKQAGGEEKLKALLKSRKISIGDFRDALRQQFLKDKLAQALGGKSVKATEKEAKAFYDRNPAQFDQPEQVRARHILVAASKGAIERDVKALKKEAAPEEINRQVTATLNEKRAKANQLYQQVKLNPSRFEIIARESSDDEGSARNGGDLGYFAREVMVPPFSKAAFSTKPGQIHDGLVQSDFGYHIIQVLDRKPARKKSFEEVKPLLLQYLENQKKYQVLEKWLETQRRSANVIQIAPEYDFDKQLQQEVGDKAKASKK